MTDHPRSEPHLLRFWWNLLCM